MVSRAVKIYMIMNKTTIFFLILLLNIPLSSKSQTRIKMKREGATYTVPCEVNGLKLRFGMDPGIKDVQISLSEVVFMLKNGYMTDKDFIGPFYPSANTNRMGNALDNMWVNLREIKIGNWRLVNIKASVISDMNIPVILGKSALQQLGAMKIEGDELVILDYDPNSNSNRFFNDPGGNKYNKNNVNDLYKVYNDSFIASNRVSNTDIDTKNENIGSSNQNSSINPVRRKYPDMGHNPFTSRQDNSLAAENSQNDNSYIAREVAPYDPLLGQPNPVNTNKDILNFDINKEGREGNFSAGLDSRIETDIYNMIEQGYDLTASKKNAEAIRYFNRAISQANNIKDSYIRTRGIEDWGRLMKMAYSGRAISYQLDRNYNAALNDYGRVLNIFNEFKLVSDIEDIYKNMGDVYMETKQYKQAIDVYKNASYYRIQNKFNDPESSRRLKDGSLKDLLLGDVTFSIGLCYQYLGDYDSSEAAFKDAVALGNDDARNIFEEALPRNESNMVKQVNTQSVSFNKVSFDIASEDKDWDVETKKIKDGYYIYARNIRSYCTLKITSYKTKKSLNDYAHQYLGMLEKESGETITIIRNKTRSRFDSPGSIDIMYDLKLSPQYGGRLIAFEKDKTSYIIHMQINKNANDDANELDRMFDSIQIK